MLPEALSDTTGKILSQQYGKPVHIRAVTPLGGGCINQAYRLDTSAGGFFIKYNRADAYKGMFASEAEGLNQLSEAGSIHVPEVLSSGEAGSYTFLMLQLIRQGKMGSDFWENFGTALANLHTHTHEQSGWKMDNYIGALPQSNRPHRDWNEFFILERLEPMVRQALDNQEISPALARKFDSLYRKLDEIIPNEPPALLHGDLWSGNFLVDETGNPCLIDPAVYFGHREVDLAMTRLFGGFTEAFYSAYHAAFPLEKGWEKRTDIFNLYPLLVHVNLFGGGYIPDVARIMAYY